jgi:hypothetical protein
MKNSLIIILFQIPLLLNAQQFEWAKSFGGIGQDQSFSISIDDSGGVYTTGNFAFTVDFDPGPGTLELTSNGDYDIFIHKIDSSGDILWAKTFGGAGRDWAYSITSDLNGNVYTTGSFSGTVDFDPGPGVFNLTSNGSENIFIHKVDAAGNFLWAKTFGGIRGRSITTDAMGNIYSTGDFMGINVDFDPGPGTFYASSNLGYQCFVHKMDASGNFLWVSTFHGNSESIETDALGNVYTTGSYDFSGDFDPGPGVFNLTSNGLTDVFIHKMDASGNFVWAKSFGGPSIDRGYSITLDGLSNVYVTGDFQDVVDFDPSSGTFNLTSKGQKDVFIHKMDASGNFLWVKSIEGEGEDRAHSITTDETGNIYATGIFNGIADFDPGPGTFNLTTASVYGAFILKINGIGDLLWAVKINGNGTGPFAINTNEIGNVYLTGAFAGNVDFDPGPGETKLTASGVSNAFILKLSQENLLSNDYDYINSGVKSFPNPTSDYINIVLNNIGNGEILITDLFGRIILNEMFDANEIRINLNNIATKGLYLVKVLDSSKNLIFTEKVYLF